MVDHPTVSAAAGAPGGAPATPSVDLELRARISHGSCASSSGAACPGPFECQPRKATRCELPDELTLGATVA